jgi:hypothetical protein
MRTLLGGLAMAPRTTTLLVGLGATLIVSCAGDSTLTLEEDHGGANQVAAATLGLCTTPEPNCTDVISMSDDGRDENGQFTGNGGCVAYEDHNFQGDSQSLDLGWVFTYVGDSFNDEISSFRVASGCQVVAWEHSGKAGEMTYFASDTAFVGDRWNDRISSWACRCD